MTVQKMPQKWACLFAEVAKQNWLQTVPKTFEKLFLSMQYI